MTVMIDRFFGVHPEVVRSGLWAKMKPGEKDLYIYLMEQSERHCQRELTRTDQQITQLVGVAGRTLCNARKKLKEDGLIQCKSGSGNKYQYTICDPTTGKPYPGYPKTPAKYQRKADRPKCQRSDAMSAKPPAVEVPELAAFQFQRNESTGLDQHGLPGVFDD